MALYGAIQRVETGVPTQPVLYEWPSPHPPEWTSAVVVEIWHGERLILYFRGCDDESPDDYDSVDEALDALHEGGPPDLCLECEDAGCRACQGGA